MKHKQIRKLQYLIKKYNNPTEKHKLFAVINLYKMNKNKHLFSYLAELGKELFEKDKQQNQTN